MPEAPGPVQRSDGAPSSETGGEAPSYTERTWTIYVCSKCGKTSTENALCCIVDRKHGKVTYGAREAVEVVEASALDHWRARSQGLEDAIRKALLNIALYADEKNYERQGNLMPAQIGSGSYARLAVNQLQAALSLGLPDEEGEESRLESIYVTERLADGGTPLPLDDLGDGAAPPPRGAAREGADVEAALENAVWRMLAAGRSVEDVGGAFDGALHAAALAQVAIKRSEK